MGKESERTASLDERSYFSFSMILQYSTYLVLIAVNGIVVETPFSIVWPDKNKKTVLVLDFDHPVFLVTESKRAPERALLKVGPALLYNER